MKTVVPATTTPSDSTVPTTAPPVLGPPAPTTTLPVDTTGQITVPNKDGTELCLLGPTAGTGEVFERKSADVGIDHHLLKLRPVDCAVVSENPLGRTEQRVCGVE